MEIPAHLNSLNPQGICKNQPIAQFEVGDFKNFNYLILDWETKRAAVVDPQKDLDVWLPALQEQSFGLECILLTHTHWDHIAGLPPLLQKFPAIPIYLHPGDRFRLKEPIYTQANLVEVNDQEVIQLGSTAIQFIHTPGHSAGGGCYFIDGAPPFLLSGDTLFIRNCGRTDLPTGDEAEMYHSLQRLKKLPSSTIILPGHHYQPECASTLQAELKTSPPLLCRSIEELSQIP